MLGNDDLGQPRSIFRVIRIGTMQEHDDVGVLLDGTTFTKVGQSRAFVVAQFDTSIQLRQRDHRQAVFLGNPLETTSNLCDLLFSIGFLVFRFDLLQIVDDDQTQVVSAFEASADGPDLSHSSTWRIVDEQRQLTQFGRGIEQCVSLIGFK